MAAADCSPQPLAAASAVGLRRRLLPELLQAPPAAFDFLKCAPDNWIGVGGRLGAMLDTRAARHPLSCHGLSLSLGRMAPLDTLLLRQTRQFLERHRAALYSEHLNYSADAGRLYELLPLAFTDAAVRHAGARIAQAQNALGRRIAVENVSYYAAPGQALSEAEFVATVLAEADCDLLLDVNNVCVNAANHGDDALAFLAAIPSARIVWHHVAGHHDDAASALKIDTHGAAVAADVWQLLDAAYRLHGVRPSLLERDSQFPPLPELLHELQRIRDAQARAMPAAQAAAHD
ncbi:DUF692 domain-containing protein [Xanthomonas theicola]|uniref:Uncharacterized protein n=1 Tax=Xanthomonas theicola TaxID=56464 RepID=A0A2S6ZJU0_9XANT|nr:DUF692 domain-containing protein [Xanthomonas theicola]PPT92527.1 hypothetical protein XthCFBP4691_03315 [Xanthomonas theicola]QNH25504.1 DUF692 domain-containing protein [Xanthomonas theicola]